MEVQGGGGGGGVPLYDETLAVDAPSFDITAISQLYDDLEIIISDARCDDAGAVALMTMRFNNDSGANYDLQYAQYNGTSGSVNATVNQTSFSEAGIATIAFIPGAAAGANIHLESTIWIRDYSRTTTRYKGFTAQSFTGVLYLVMAGGEWSDTDPIDRVTIFPLAGSDFLAGTRCRVRGH